ncbi:unnamed protein product [Fusarium equiseti]|uniref:Uncharacterized protein n=1 Tax=Fusarium equiseti TaxID=61235 RepID=A0A8J2IML1_FUSEQ|nr:unnamed protein product [Fusarium equiseti]
MTTNSTRSFADRTVIGVDELNAQAAPRNLKDVADDAVLVVEWAFQFSIENESESERTKQMETEIGMTATSGTEVSNHVSAKARFSGFGFSAEANASTQSKTFTSIETSNKTRVTDKYVIPSHSSIYVYKRKYRFRCNTWVYWAPENAWLEMGGKKVEAQFDNEIVANQELISPAELKN